MNTWRKIREQPGFIMTVNFMMMMVIYTLSRWFFYYINIDIYPDVSIHDMIIIFLGGLRFDLSALCFLNIPCLALQFLPFRNRETMRYQRIAKYIFIFVNALGIVANMFDTVYFEFGGRRSTSTIFSEFGGESNLSAIVLNSVTLHWMVWLFGIAMIVAMTFLYYNPIKSNKPYSSLPNKVYYPLHSGISIIVLILIIGSARGGFGLKMHPICQV